MAASILSVILDLGGSQAFAGNALIFQKRIAGLLIYDFFRHLAGR
jgi:hypothetical protein